MNWLFRQRESNARQKWDLVFDSAAATLRRGDLTGAVSGALVDPLLAQWEDAGLAISQEGGWRIPWESVYHLIRDESYYKLTQQLGIPAVWILSPRLVSRGALTDPTFSISIDGWINESGQAENPQLNGPIARTRARTGLIPEASWKLLQRIATFAQRSEDARTEGAHRLAWGEIRRAAVVAAARMDDFLVRTVVLVPDKLRIDLRRSGKGSTSMIEVLPDFEGCPAGWLTAFDKNVEVRDRYDLVSPDGVVQVIVTAAVKTVLEQIRRMPGRRVAGARAEAFVTNPFAALGEAAGAVIDPEQFEQARAEAGLIADRFVAHIDRDRAGVPVYIGISMETSDDRGARSSHYRFKTDDEAKEFVANLHQRLADNCQLFAWRDYEFELLGNAEDEAQKIDDALGQRASAAKGAPTADTIYDLSMYSDRILGIGEEKDYASPYIAKLKEDSGWFPDNVAFLIELPPESPGGDLRYMALDNEALSRFKADIQKARDAGDSKVNILGTVNRIPITEAEDLIRTFDRAAEDSTSGRLRDAIDKNSKRKKRKGLLIKPNIDVVDYMAERIKALTQANTRPTLPAALRPGTELKQHQLDGVAWMQHLFNCSPQSCRGAVLADDMGLGKTLQLLTLIAWSHESDPELPPALVIAPVALLENWRDELNKFFDPGALPVLEVYGDTLKSLRVPSYQIDEQLRQDGLVRFLRSEWVGNAKIVLTTYETLRDLEFSFASEKWSILVCDEAQKIKNPNALVTRAAKKQNARFRVACTGTPVENTLADLWCLFDLVQPGLLGALNDFGQRYRRPIEDPSEEAKCRIDELRGLIDPQLLRRLKRDVAKDLPNKWEVKPCKALPLTPTQRGLYSSAVAKYGARKESEAPGPFKNALGLLQYLRLICTDPRLHGMGVSLNDSVAEYRKKSAKLHWLIPTLMDIQKRGEKALLFCEFKDIQRLLRHYIAQELGFTADIINGDTSASSKHEQSRHKRLSTFQKRPGFGVIILSPLAVGYGVNLQAANHVIHYTRTWNPAKEDQATDRAYRIGQKKDVFVYCPVVVASDFVTFDVRLDQLLARKRSLAEDMLNGSGDVGPSEFDIPDVAPPGAPDLQPQVLAMADIMALKPRHFEAYVAILWQRRGFRQVVLGPGSGDGGVDVVAINGTVGELIQCKTSQSTDKALGWEAIKEVVGGEAAYLRLYPGVSFTRVCISNVVFNRTATLQAAHNSVRLVDRHLLDELQAGHLVTLEDVEKTLHPTWSS